MKLLYKKLDLEIEIEENVVPVLVIENIEIFKDMIYSIICQSKGENGNIILSENYKEIAIGKNVELIFNPFELDPGNKKVMAKIYSDIESIIVSEYALEMTQINADIINLLDKVLLNMQFDITYEPEINKTSLLKAIGLSVTNQESELLSQIINYTKIVHQILGIRLFIFVNLKMYLSSEELKELYKTMHYEKIHLLLLEGIQKNIMDGEKVWIIDKDLCIIG